MRSTDLPEVRALPLFESMAEANFEQLMQAAYLQIFPAQLELIKEGEPADFLYVVIDGCVELYASWNGHETVMEMVRPLGTFILAAVLKDAIYLKSGRTSQRSRLLLIPAAFPAILAGLKIGWAFAWRTLIAAELVFGASARQGGLGWHIFEARAQLETATVFSGLLVVIVIGLLVESVIFRAIEARTVNRWGMQR